MGKYVIFHIDGTLNRTDLYAVEAYQKALAKRKCVVSCKEIISCIGLTQADIIDKLFRGLEDEEVIRWTKDIRNYEIRLMKMKAQPFEGIEEVLCLLKEKGYGLAICSNAFLEHIHQVLESIGLRKYFTAIGSLMMGSNKSIIIGEAVKECIRRGVCKVNYATDLRIAFSKGINDVLREHPETIDPKKYNARGREEVKQYVMDKIKVCGSVGKAQCSQ